MTIKHPLTKSLSKHPLVFNPERGWLKESLRKAKQTRDTMALMRKGVTLVDINNNPLVEDLVELVNKYAREACSCDIMNGWQCLIHQQVRDNLKAVLDKYKDSDSLKNVRIEV